MSQLLSIANCWKHRGVVDPAMYIGLLSLLLHVTSHAADEHQSSAQQCNPAWGLSNFPKPTHHERRNKTSPPALSPPPRPHPAQLASRQLPSPLRSTLPRHGAGSAGYHRHARAPTAPPDGRRQQQRRPRRRPDARRPPGLARLRDPERTPARQLPHEQEGHLDLGQREHPRPHGQVFPHDRDGEGNVPPARAVFPTTVCCQTSHDRLDICDEVLTTE